MDSHEKKWTVHDDKIERSKSLEILFMAHELNFMTENFDIYGRPIWRKTVQFRIIVHFRPYSYDTSRIGVQFQFTFKAHCCSR